MRLFIAINLPEEVLDEIWLVQEKLSGKKLFRGKITERENIHLTLKFIGDVSSDELDEIKAHLSKVEWETFDANINHLGVFDEKEVRIIWAKLNGAEKLQKMIDLELVDLYPLEKRFMSHITLFRVKEVYDIKKLLDELSKIKFQSNFKVSSFYLMESKLDESGPTYKVLKEYRSDD